MFLGRDNIESLVKRGLIEGYSSLEKQVTANGFDLRLGVLIEVENPGIAGDTKRECTLPVIGRVWALGEMVEWIERDSGLGIYGSQITAVEPGTPVTLESDKYYLGVTVERVNMPEHLVGVLQSRTTMFRMAGVFLGTGFVEAGYRGRLTIGMCSPSGGSVRLGARFVQIAFSFLRGRGNYESQDSLHYQNGKIL